MLTKSQYILVNEIFKIPVKCVIYVNIEHQQGHLSEVVQNFVSARNVPKLSQLQFEVIA